MKKDVLVIVVGIVVVAALCYGLTLLHKPVPPATSPVVATAEPAAKSSPSASASKVVMKVNGQPVTAAELEMVLAEAPEQLRAVYASPIGRPQFGQQVAKLVALAQEGAKLGAADDPELQQRVQLERSKAFANFALTKLASKPTDAEVRKLYETEKGRFTTHELSHILIAYQGGEVPPRQGTPLPVDQAMKKAEAVEQELKRGTDFGELAKAVSDDTGSAPQGGALGPVGGGMLPKELEQVAFALQPGQVSAPVRTQFGIHILKAGKVQSRTYEQVRPLIENQLAEKTMTARVDDLMKTAKIEYVDPSFSPAAAPKTGAPRTPAGAPVPRGEAPVPAQ